MKKLLSVAVIVSLGVAADIMPYGAYLDYSSNALKDNGYVLGVYGSLLKKQYKFELDAEHINIKYKKSANLDDWKQSDLTFIANYYQGYNYAYKAGIHNIWTKQGGNSEYDKVFILGGLYYQYLKYNAGADFYYSDYKDFNVYQISPSVGFNFGNYNSNTGSFYTEVKYNYIHISNKIKARSNKNNYSNIDIKLQNFKGPWTSTINVSFGKNAYKVANGGFVVYNLGEEYKYNAGLSVQYAIDKNDNIKVSYSRSKYNNGSEDSYSNVYSISYLRAF
jgi:hypothetical protein